MSSSSSAQPASAPKNDTPNANTSSSSTEVPVFPVGPAGKRALKRALVRSTDPARTIQDFQQKHSLHAMMGKAFGTTPQHEYRATRRQSITKTVESLDTDSVMTFLSHLGVRQHEVHKRVADALMNQLEDEIRKCSKSNNKSKKQLLDLLQSCWVYAATMPELRPVLWAVLKQLGDQTPLAVLVALAEREPTTNEEGEQVLKLKHAEIYEPLPPLLKRLCWEADWDKRVPLDQQAEGKTEDIEEYLQTVQSTLLYETLAPLLEQYCSDALLVEAANRPFVSTVRERRMLTKQRRALTTTTTSSSILGSTAATTTTTTTSGLLRSTQAAAAGSAATATTAATSTSTPATTFTSGKAVSQIRGYLCDTVGSASTFRPKLLYALLSILMAQHGKGSTAAASSTRSGDGMEDGADNHLQCTLVSDILLSAGGPLPKAYQYVLLLARLLDDSVQEGNLSDEVLSRVQSALRHIFQPDIDNNATAPAAASPSHEKKKQAATASAVSTQTSNSIKRQLNRIITAGLNAMKDADPQNLFLNPVTDAIAPGYSKIIKQPMSIVTMEEKVEHSSYDTLQEWQVDVKLVFKNCVDYNRGKAGQWFRGEAQRQSKVFADEIFPQARRLYAAEMAKRSRDKVTDEADERERKGMSSPTIAGGNLNDNAKKRSGPEIALLPATSKKRKKEKEEYLPSMPALACMLLADPFVVRILLARVLRELRRGVMNGTSIPAAHAVVPSLLQLLQLGRWSRRVCAVRGQRYGIPDGGIVMSSVDDSKKTRKVPFDTLRRYVPLLLRLLLESELDKRIERGGDLHLAASSQSLSLPDPLGVDAWKSGINSVELQVAVSLVEAALVFICQPGMGNDTSLAVTFPKFGLALRGLSSPSLLCHDRPFFICLTQALLRHKSKLPKQTRDAIFRCWLEWLKQSGGDHNDGTGSVTSVAHEYIVRLLNEWSSLGNLLLPRDTLLQFSLDAIKAADASAGNAEKTCAELWNSEDGQDAAVSNFAPIKQQYERMLKFVPAAQAEEWKELAGIIAVVDAEAEAEEGESNTPPEDEPMVTEGFF